MFKTQRFALENIYCAPGQDQQFSFSLVRINNVNQPLSNVVSIYNVNKKLPSAQYKYHVFILGNINPLVLNLLKQGRDWFKDVWIKVSDDLVARNYLLKMYNDYGVMYPRQHIYYSFIDESSIIVALEFDYSLKTKFDVNSFKYLHLYSNSYFNTIEFNTLQNRLGIQYDFKYVTNNVDKVALQNKIQTYETSGGKAIVYVNGYYTDNINLNIPDGNYIEVIYDQSIISKEIFNISDLRTFQSTKDNKLKYLIFRDKIIDRIQYQDDNEIYIRNNNTLVTKGLYFYQHKDYAVNNVTDKDYSLYTNFVNNTAQTISNLTSGSINDKVIVLYTRKSGLNRQLIYSSLKLHELYKLPQNIELDVLSNTNYTINELRAETLENSDYFKIASAVNIKDVTKELSASVLGYNGISYYFANTPTVVNTGNVNIDVPDLYQDNSTAFEYDAQGNFTGTYLTSGPIYSLANANTKFVEFLYGQTPLNYGRLYGNTETITLEHYEYRVLSAYFNGVNRLTNWEDITNNSTKCIVNNNNTITLNESNNYKVKIVYLNQPNIYDIQLDLTTGVLYFPLTIKEDRGTGLQIFPIDVPYSNIEIYLNNRKLTYNLDYFMKFPYVCIVNKKYIDYTLQYQNVHIRMYGFTLNEEDINKLETSGFVNHGVLLRNKKFDIKDDKVMSIYIDGRMYNRSNLLFAEEDNTVRLSNPLNGLPYIIKEPFIAIKSISGVDTLDLYTKNLDVNKKISDLFNLIYPEPAIDETNIITDHHYVYSPVVSKIINDLIDGNIASSLYTNPYNDSTILTLLDTSPYKELLLLDPIKHNMPDNLVEIHPHVGNTVINLNLYQYRFVDRVISLLTNGNNSKINISGYLTVTA